MTKYRTKGPILCTVSKIINISYTIIVRNGINIAYLFP